MTTKNATREKLLDSMRKTKAGTTTTAKVAAKPKATAKVATTSRAKPQPKAKSRVTKKPVVATKPASSAAVKLNNSRVWPD